MFGLVIIPYVCVPTLTRNDPRVKYCALDTWFPMLVAVKI